MIVSDDIHAGMDVIMAEQLQNHPPTFWPLAVVFIACVAVILGVGGLTLHTELPQPHATSYASNADPSGKLVAPKSADISEDDAALASARLAESQGDERLARSLYLSFLATRSGPASEKEAFVLKRLGVLYERQGHMALAEGFHEESVSTLVEVLGKNHPQVVREIKTYARTTNGLRLANSRPLPDF